MSRNKRSTLGKISNIANKKINQCDAHWGKNIEKINQSM